MEVVARTLRGLRERESVVEGDVGRGDWERKGWGVEFNFGDRRAREMVAL